MIFDNVPAVTRPRCNGRGCPCVNHQPPPGYALLLAEIVPPNPSQRIAGIVWRAENMDGERAVAFEAPDENGRYRWAPLPEPLPESWRPAIDRAERFVTRTPPPVAAPTWKAVTAR